MIVTSLFSEENYSLTEMQTGSLGTRQIQVCAHRCYFHSEILPVTKVLSTDILMAVGGKGVLI